MIRFLVHFSTGDVQIEIEAGSSELLPMTMCFLAWFGVHLQGHAQTALWNQHGNKRCWKFDWIAHLETFCYGNILLWKHLVMETSCYGNILLWKHLVSPPLTLEYLGVVRQEISEKYFTWPHEIYPPPHVFGASKRCGGGPPDATF